MNRITIKGIITTIPQNVLTCQRIVKSLSTFCKSFNVLISHMTTQQIVITIPHFIFIIIYIFLLLYVLYFHIIITIKIIFSSSSSGPGHIIGDTEGVGSLFHVFALPDMFSAVLRASGPIIMFCVSELVFGGTVGVGSRFHVLRYQTHFRRYRGRRVLFSCFALPNSFSTVPTASGTALMFCATRLVFGGTEGVGSRFHVLRSRTRFRLYRGRRVPFSCSALPDSF
jgi:hypothetical protein